MNRRWYAVLWAAVLMLFLCIMGHAFAATSQLSWEYWQEDAPDGAAKPAKEPPAFAKGTGRWRSFDPQFGVAVPAGTHYVWIRVYIPPDTGVDESLFFATTDQSVQIFLDGVSIYRYGDLGQKNSSYGYKWHLVDLPAWAVGRQLVLQVYADNIWVLGQFDRVRLDRASHLIEQLFLFDFPYVSGMTALVIFMLLLAVYFFTEKNLRDIYLRLIVVLLVFFIWMISSSSLILFWSDWPVFWWNLELISSYLIPLSTNVLIYRIIDDDYKKRIFQLSGLYGIIFFLAVVLELLGLNGLYLMRFFFYPALAVCGFVTAYILWVCQKRGSVHCRALLVAFGTLSTLAVIDGMAFQYRLFSCHSYVLPFGIYTIGFFIVQLILDRAAHERYLAELSASLENKVDLVTRRMEIDPLTNVFNRNKFPSAMRDFMRIARETKEPFSILMFDIDHFKKINDTYGHDVGDEVLVGFTQIIRSFLDRRHILIRWGGEEFILLCLHYDGAQAEAFGNIIREAVAAACIHPSTQVTCSGGVSVWYGTDADTPDRLVKRADTALYQSKQNGRNCITRALDRAAPVPQRCPQENHGAHRKGQTKNAEENR